jgi:hypothetical protein
MNSHGVVIAWLHSVRPGFFGPLPGHLLGQDGGTLLLGEDFFPWIILAFGAAMVVGNGLALIRSSRDGTSIPVGRALAFIAFGLLAAVWGLASLLR